jgi:hypothetical protein
MSLPAVLARIAQAQNNEDLTAIWQQWTNTYGPDSWTGEVNVAGHRRMSELMTRARQPQTGGNPLV